MDYYQNVAVLLREFTDKFSKMKNDALQRNRQWSPEEAKRRITEKANTIVNEEMEMYEVVKEVENILRTREKRLSGIVIY